MKKLSLSFPYIFGFLNEISGHYIILNQKEPEYPFSYFDMGRISSIELFYDYLGNLETKIFQKDLVLGSNTNLRHGRKFVEKDKGFLGLIDII